MITHPEGWIYIISLLLLPVATLFSPSLYAVVVLLLYSYYLPSLLLRSLVHIIMSLSMLLYFISCIVS